MQQRLSHQHAENRRIAAQLEAKDEKIRDQDRQISNLRATVDEREFDIRSMREEVRRVKNTRDAALVQLSQEKAALERVQQALQESKTLFAQEKFAHNNTQAELAKARPEKVHRELEAEVIRLKQEIASIKPANEEYENTDRNDMSEEEETYEATMIRVQQLEASMQERDGLLQTKDTVITQKTSQIACLTTENRRLKKKKSSLLREIGLKGEVEKGLVKIKPLKAKGCAMDLHIKCWVRNNGAGSDERAGYYMQKLIEEAVHFDCGCQDCKEKIGEK